MFLAQQGLFLSGHNDQGIQTESDSNSVQLTKLQGEDDYRIISWLEKKTNKCFQNYQRSQG